MSSAAWRHEPYYTALLQPHIRLVSLDRALQAGFRDAGLPLVGRHLASRRSLDHQVRQAVSIVAAAAALLLAALSSPAPELQAENAPAP